MNKGVVARRGATMVGLAWAALLLASAGRADPMSGLFPYCWGGNENTGVFYVEGLLTRQIVLYGNTDETRPLTKVQLVVDLPLGAAELVYAVASDGPGRVMAGEPQLVGPNEPFDPTRPRLWKTPLYHNAQGSNSQQSDTLYRGEPYAHYVVPLWDIRPGYRWRGKAPWSEWPGAWTTLYIRGKRPGRYAVYWQLRTAEGDGPERLAPLQVLERPKPPTALAKRPGAGVGVAVNSLSLYGDFGPVAHGLAGSLRACGARRVYLTARSALSAAAARAAGLEVFLTNPWPSNVFAPQPPADNCRACDSKGKPVPGNAWCPTYVAWGGEQWQAVVAPLVTGDMKTLGAEGFLLDYEAVGAPGWRPCDLCFCARCREAFAKELGAELRWPGDVLEGGRYRERWLAWRQEQTAWYVKRIADLARAANARAQVMVRTAGCYEPEREHEVYTVACSDLTLAARSLTAAGVKAAVYPNHFEEAFAPPCGFGTEPGNFGASVLDMVDLLATTVRRLAPRPVVASLAGAPPPISPATPLATTALLRWQAVNHLMDGVSGLDFWEIGPCEDGRYLHLLAELAGLGGLIEQSGVSGPLPEAPGVTTEARYWRAAWTPAADGALVWLLNGDNVPRRFTVPYAKGVSSIGLVAGELRLVPANRPPAGGGGGGVQRLGGEAPQAIAAGRNRLAPALTTPSTKRRLAPARNWKGLLTVPETNRSKCPPKPEVL